MRQAVQMRDKLVVGGICVLAYFMLCVPGGYGFKVASKEQEPPRGQAAPAPKVYTAEDYWKPLDAWLKSQGSPLDGRAFWEIGNRYKIDPDFLIAITGAETNFCKVKQRGSQFNCGSVGSYDSTSTTYPANSYEHGIELIARTLNNDLLGKYNTVGQLSRAHNPTGPVYATSPVNWERNTLHYLSQIKGKPVDHTYNFRR